MNRRHAFWNELSLTLLLSALMLILLSGCLPFGDGSPSTSSAGTLSLGDDTELANGIYGVSPTTLQLKWKATANYASTQVYSSQSGEETILQTDFQTGFISGLLPSRSYELHVYGITPLGAQSASPLGAYDLVTWPGFSNAPLSAKMTSLDPVEGTVLQISWDYAPWTELAAGDNVQTDTMIRCYFAPAETPISDPFGDPKAPSDPFTNATATTDAPVASKRIVTNPISLGISGPVNIGCEARYIDGTISRNAAVLSALLIPNLKPCPQSSPLAIYDKLNPFQCTLSDVLGAVGGSQFKFQLDPVQNTCTFVTVDQDGNLYGVPTDSNVGTCTLAYDVVTGGSVSPFTQTLTIVNVAATWTSPPLPTQVIKEISRNDPGVGALSTPPNPPNPPNMSSLLSNPAYTVHITDAQVQTNKETYAAASNQNYGAYQVDNSSPSNCAKFGRILHGAISNPISGIDPQTGEFYFEPEEYYYGTCSVTLYFNDGHPRNNLSLPFVITIQVIGFNDPPNLTPPFAANSTYNCGSHCYVGVDYDIQFNANTGGINPNDPTHTGENDQTLLSPTCQSTDPASVKVSCTLNPQNDNIFVEITPIAIPSTGPVSVTLNVCDNGDPTNPNMPSAADPPGAKPGSSCAQPFTFFVDVQQFNLGINPALVVSKAACLMCHANIGADVVTDFGNSTEAIADPVNFPNLFFSSTDPVYPVAPPPDVLIYNRAMNPEGWESIESIGTLYVKRTHIDTPFFDQHIQGPTDLATFLRDTSVTINGLPLSDPGNGGYNPWPHSYVSQITTGPGPGELDVAGTNVLSTATPNISDTLPNGQVINNLIISWPTASDIQTIARQSYGPANQINWLAAAPDAQPLYRVSPDPALPRPFSGFLISQMQPVSTQRAGSQPLPTASPYVTNDLNTPIECYGDVVIRGDLLLDAPTFKTDERGCRLYVDGNVIFHGYNNFNGGAGIQVQSTNPNFSQPYVQVTSDQQIAFGVTQSRLADRMRAVSPSMQAFAANIYVPRGDECTDGTNIVVPSSTSCPAGYVGIATGLDCVNGNDFATGIFGCPSGYTLAPSSGVLDGYPLPPGLAGWNWGTIAYNHLMVNAQTINGRYEGQFNGSIIADYAIMRLDSLTFDFDTNAFSGVVPFPRLQTIKSQATGLPRVIFSAGQ